MMQYHGSLKKTGMKALLTALALTATLTPMRAWSAERDGTVLFFPFEELRQVFSNPMLPQLLPRFAWRMHYEHTDQRHPLERFQLWGNNLRPNGHLYPGAGRPLWGE